MNAILTITGSDSGGGAGIQADIKAISQMGGYAVTAITSITMQNTLGIQSYFDLPPETVRGQVEAIVNDVQPKVVKIGMIRTQATLNVIVDLLNKYKPQFVVYDATVTSANGEQIVPDDVREQIAQRLVPLCSLVIGNQDEWLGTNAVPGRTYTLDKQQLHGFSNGFASAVAVYVSQGNSLSDALKKAADFAATHMDSQSDLQGRSGELYNMFLTAIDDHGHEYHDVNYYADLLNVSSRYLAQVTHKVSRLSPKQIIDQKMTERLQASLLTTTRTLQQIAYDYGFSSQQHFSKFFKKMTGTTPTLFRYRKRDTKNK